MSIVKKIGESSLLSRKTPEFWHQGGLMPQLMLPLSVLYFLLKRLFVKKGAQQEFDGVKVICVGNITAGGAGKTPAAMAIYKRLNQAGVNACFITTGFRGRLRGPLLVDLNKHSGADVGDEAALLAKHGNVVMCKNRLDAVKFAADHGFKTLVLDDGMHDTRIKKHVAFLVIDGAYGFGNGLLMPAGPLRDRIDIAAADATHILLIGEDKRKVVPRVNDFLKKKLPLVKAYITPLNEPKKDTPYVAFAGLARPEKFFDMLKGMDVNVAERVALPDHYDYGSEDVETLRNMAKQHKARLITTAKDMVKLPKEFAAEVECMNIELAFEDKGIDNILEG